MQGRQKFPPPKLQLTLHFLRCSFGQDAPKAAKLLANLVDRVYYVKDGAIGPAGWRVSSEHSFHSGSGGWAGMNLNWQRTDGNARFGTVCVISLSFVPGGANQSTLTS